ncbi:MAG: acyl-CoA dehydrogenase family protein, partial [Kofleriaceae bacterium]|nr:acyl-CoA dehydrogenase family protein [Kofleriaceae bacterium]
MLGTTLDSKLVNPTEEHAMLRQTVREFTRKEIEPQAEEYDQKGILNQGLLRKVGDLGLLGITIPEEFGG